jgi:hypothetical protein
MSLADCLELAWARQQDAELASLMVESLVERKATKLGLNVAMYSALLLVAWLA